MFDRRLTVWILVWYILTAIAPPVVLPIFV